MDNLWDLRNILLLHHTWLGHCVNTEQTVFTTEPLRLKFTLHGEFGLPQISNNINTKLLKK